MPVTVSNRQYLVYIPTYSSRCQNFTMVATLVASRHKKKKNTVMKYVATIAAQNHVR